MLDLLWVSPKAGKRESRRFLGDYILTQTDLEDGRRFPDDIAYGGHGLDDHQPFRGNGNIFFHSIPPIYGIPYRCCYSRNITNLFLAGRLISATHLAHSSTRVMRTGAAIGQALGMAAALCCQYGCTPCDVYVKHMDELQQKLLQADATILAKPLKPDSDLAQQATAKATSELRFNDQEPGQPVPLTAPAGNILWDWNPYIETVGLFLVNDSNREQNISLSIHRTHQEQKWTTLEEHPMFYLRNDLRDSAFKRIATADTVLPPNYKGWVEIKFPVPVHVGQKDPASDDDRLLIVLDENRDVSWALATRSCEIAEMVEHSHYTAQWKMLEVLGTMRITPPPHLGEAENAVNGFHRRFSCGPTNMWISDPAQTFPQDLVLEWSQPQQFNQVTLTFDNLPRLIHEDPWECGKRAVDKLVKAYELYIWENGAWREIVREECNHHRFRIHAFNRVTTDKLLLKVLSTHGEKNSARVYQVCVYNK